MPLTLVFALLLALLLARIGRGGAVYRFLIYFPVLVPGVVAGLIWLFLTNVDFGLFNNILRAVGAKPVIWLGARTGAAVLAAVDVWRNTGYWAIFFVAALIGLPKELYQAAALGRGRTAGAVLASDAADAAADTALRGRRRRRSLGSRYSTPR